MTSVWLGANGILMTQSVSILIRIPLFKVPFLYVDLMEIFLYFQIRRRILRTMTQVSTFVDYPFSFKLGKTDFFLSLF